MIDTHTTTSLLKYLRGTLAEGLRVVMVVLSPWLPDTAERLLAALGTPDVSLEGARLGAGGLERVERLEPLFPKEASAAA